jgi:Spy/CpxP family protein refolding chaperone
MNRHVVRITLALVVVLGLALTVTADDTPNGPPPEHAPLPHLGPPPLAPQPPAFWKDAKIVTYLQLTDAQVEDLDDLAAETDVAGQALRGQLEKTGRALEEALRQESIDGAKVRRLTKTLGDLEAQRVNLVIEHRLQVNLLLDADQREKLANLPRPAGAPPRR